MHKSYSRAVFATKTCEYMNLLSRRRKECIHVKEIPAHIRFQVRSMSFPVYHHNIQQ